MFEVNDIPPICCLELQELIEENVKHDEFLFFRVNHGDDLDWILGEADDYECFCTACQQHFAEDRKSGPASYWDACPRCGARITPRRWNNGKAKFLALTAFAFHFFQPGEHGDMWLTSCQVRMNPDFQCGKYLANEYARYCFSEFGSRKWIWKENGWKRTKSICFKRWQAMGGYCYDNFWALPSEQDLAGSCLRYSQLTQAWSCVPDLPEYLAFYLKFPGAEYLWKMGFGRWLVERQEGKGHLFRKLVNLRAKEPKRLFLHLSKADRRLLGRERVNLADGAAYQDLRQAGAVECSEDGLQYACATVRCRFVWQTTAEQCGLSGKELRKYIERPAEVRELTEEELEEIRSKVREENAEAAKAAEERARAAEEKLDKAKNPAAHKVNFLFGEVRGLVERLEQALGELEQTDEAACEKFAAVIAKWLKERGDGLA